jgi:septum formation protein
VSVPPAPPLLLASTSPQRRAILKQLHIPFDAVAPKYEEHDPPDADATKLVCDHAVGKARSVAGEAGDRLVLGVDTTVVLDGRIYAKPADAGGAEQMLEELSGRTHAVVSGVCLITPGWEVVEAAATLVTFRALTPRDLGLYVASGEWEGRAGGYAIQVSAPASSSGSRATISTSSACRPRYSYGSLPRISPARTASASPGQPRGLVVRRTSRRPMTRGLTPIFAACLFERFLSGRDEVGVGLSR